MTDEEIDKIIFDTIPAPLEAGINEMRSLVLAGMAAEREACAKVADEAVVFPKWHHDSGDITATDIAAAIRKRSIEPTTP